MFILRHSEVNGRTNSAARGTEQNQKLVLLNKWFVRTSTIIFSDTIFAMARFEKMIQNVIFLFQQTELRACFLCEMFCDKIPKVCFYFCSMVQNSEHFSLPRNCSERNSESYQFRGTAGIPPEQTNSSVYSDFHGIIFLSEIANLSLSFQPITRHSKE